MNERRSLSWVMPVLLAIFIIFPTAQYGDGWVWWGRGAAWLSGLTCAVWGILNLLLYVADNALWMWKDMADAIYRTSPAGMAKAIEQLRPDQIRLLTRTTGGTWVLKLSPEEDQGAEYMLWGPELLVPIEFIKFVIDHSDDLYLYPQNRFNDQAYNWDATSRQYTDRDYYKALQSWLFGQNMVEWPRGNQPARWKNGWSPARLARRLDLDAFSYEETRAQPLALAEMDEVLQQGSGGAAVRVMKQAK